MERRTTQKRNGGKSKRMIDWSQNVMKNSKQSEMQRGGVGNITTLVFPAEMISSWKNFKKVFFTKTFFPTSLHFLNITSQQIST